MNSLQLSLFCDKLSTIRIKKGSYRVAKAAKQPFSDQVWPRLESWLAKARAQADARRETPALVLENWAKLARAALVGDHAVLAEHLSRLRAQLDEETELVDAVADHYETVVELLGASGPPPDPDLWRQLTTCQGLIFAAAARLTHHPAQPPTHHLQTLFSFSREIIPILNPETLIEQAVSRIHRGFGYEYIHLFLMEATGQQVILRGGLWRDQPADLDSYGALHVGEEGISGWVAEQGKPIIIPDVKVDSRFKPHPALSEVRSEMAAPLNVGGRILGVLEVLSEEDDAFSEADLFLLQALADQIAVAIENARLHFGMQRRLHEQTILYETSAAISANLDADTVLKAIAAKLTEAVSVGGCAICQWEAERNTIISVAEHIADSDQGPARAWRTSGRPIPLDEDPVATRVLQTRRPALIYGSQGDGTPWQSLGWGALLALPMQLEDRIIGLVELYERRASRQFTNDDVQLCQALAHQAAIAIERIRLFNETRRRLNEVSELYTLANEISTNLNLSEVLKAIVEAIRRAMGCRGCCIFLLDETGELLEIKAAAGLKPKWRDAARLRVGEGVAGRAAEGAQSIYLPDTLKDPDYIFFDREVRSLLAVPLQIKGRVIGVINVDDRVPNAFGPDQERLLTIAAAQASIAIENARLFSEMLSDKQRTDAIIRYMADGLLMLNQHGVVLSCNPALAMMLGMRRGDILGQQGDAPDADPRLQAICEPATVKERTGVLAREVQIPRTGPAGETLRPRSLRVYSSVVNDETGQSIGEVRVVHDVTKEREIEEMKDEFFSTISHELRTPLFSIQGFARLILKGEVPEEEEQREFLGIIARQAEQLAQLVNNLLNISRLESGMLALERKPVQLVDVLQGAVSKLRGIAQGKDIALETDLPASLPVIAGDRDWLEQVATNLVGNAVKFTPEGGQVRVVGRHSKGEILVEVQDTGIGIPSGALDRVFTKYYRVPDDSGQRPEGTGLGLHIAKKIIEAHGGQIWAESQAGQGSTFRFSLPCGQAKT